MSFANTSEVLALFHKAVFKSAWSANVQVMFHHSALVCVLEITLLASILIQVQAVYVVSVAEIVLPSAATCIFVPAIIVSCFQDQVVLNQVLSAKSLISKSQATYVVSVAEIVFQSLAICIFVQAIRVSCFEDKSVCVATTVLSILIVLFVMSIQVQAEYVVSVSIVCQALPS